jgi:hypothetical protein
MATIGITLRLEMSAQETCGDHLHTFGWLVLPLNRGKGANSHLSVERYADALAVFDGRLDNHLDLPALRRRATGALRP